MDPERQTGTLTFEGRQGFEKWVRSIIREEITKALEQYGARFDQVILGGFVDPYILKKAGAQDNLEWIQDVPETSNTDRMHDLDINCWCEPQIDGPYLRHRKVQP